MRVLTLALVCLATPAAAQDTPDATSVIRLFDLVASYELPPWSPDAVAGENAGGQDILASEISRQQGATPNGTELFLFEYIPAGESFEDWSTLYAITAETPLDGALEAYMNGQVNLYSRVCDGVSWSQVLDRPDWKMFFILCGAYKDRPDTGEIAVLSYVKPTQTLVKHYVHQRGPAFDVQDTASWPLTEAEIQAHIDRLAKLRLSPADP